MSNIEHIRNTIKSTRKTQKITGTMQSVALSKLYKAKQTMELSKPYAEKMLAVIGHIAHSHSEYRHCFLEQRQQRVKRVGYIVVSSDRGLCGGLNSNLFKKLVTELRDSEARGVKASMCLIGNKAMQYFERISVEVLGHAHHLGDRPSVLDTVGIVQMLLDRYRQGQLDAVYLVSNQFISMMVQKPRILKLLPLVPAEPEHTATGHWDYLYEPDAKEALDRLLTRYIESLVYQAVIENIACEQASRMMAMESATKNAQEIIENLQLSYNKARQAAITQELAEIVAGAAAV
jgi:F-type H+-transporting ATPase subunit gamma